MKKISTLILLCFLYSIKINAQQINTAKLDSFFNILKAHDKVMGSFAIAKNGQIIYQRAVGYRSLKGDSIAADAATTYRIGSITKTFTATMILQQIEKKKLSLDTRLSKYFPQMPNAEQITIKNLLTHTSGLMDFVNDMPRDWITFPHPKTELLDTIAKRKPHFAPGTTQRYSNSGYLILAYILENISGKSYSELIKVSIFDKLKLKNTVSGIANGSGKNEALSYSTKGNWTEVKDIYFPNVIGVGDILSTTTDMITFLDGLNAGKLITPESFREMSTFEGTNAMALGLIKIPFYKQTGLGHNGGTYGTFSSLYNFKDGGITVATSINGANYNPNDILIALLSAAYNLPVKIPVFSNFVVAEKDLKAYLGVYENTVTGLKLIITRQGNLINAQMTDQPAITLEPVALHSFKFAAAQAEFDFDVIKHEIILKQFGNQLLFKKENK